MAEELFWQVLKNLQTTHPDFGFGHKYSGVPKRFKRTIVAVDSSTIQLIAKCISWAKHRKQKAAAKCHMQLNLQTFLPQFAIVKGAGTHDSTEAYELCSNLKDGEIVVFDKAYVDFKHLYQLKERGVFWVTRAKDNMKYRIIESCGETNNTSILGDYIVELEKSNSKEKYPDTMRLVIAEVEVNNKPKVMSFITDNKEWAPSSICDLYKARWGVEVFFKQIKQTLQLGSFLGHSENAIRWQVWMAMLAYVLLRFISYVGQWKGSFSRLFTLLRGVLTSRLDMYSVMQACYGTAPGKKCAVLDQKQAYLPGFDTG
jgi:transposase